LRLASFLQVSTNHQPEITMLAVHSITASRFVRGALTYVLSPLISAAVGVALATAIIKTAAAATPVKARPGIAPVVAESGQLSDDLLRMIERLQRAPAIDERNDSEPAPADAPNALAPGVGLTTVIARLENLLKSAAGAQSAALDKALIELRRAQSTLHTGGEPPSLSYYRVAYDQVKNAQLQLQLASSVVTAKPLNSELADIQRNLVLITQHAAKAVLDATRRAGVSPERLAPAQVSFQRGQAAFSTLAYAVATGHFGDSLGLAANTITFDVDLFEQNIIDALDDETVGYSLSITFNGQTHNGGHAEGLARTAADAPMTAQSPNKDMHVASVSKTLTTIVTLHVLDVLGLTPQEPVAPYLPSDWSLGTGVSELTFKDFMTHRTGFGQQEVSGSSYESLRALIAEDVGVDSFDYDNDNFGLLRVAVAGLLGIDPVDYPDYSPDELTAAVFLMESQFLYSSIGVSVDCKATDPNPTIQYRFPDTGASGYDEPDRSLSCGGFGWFINANELAGVMSTLRNTEQLMSSQMREQMQDDFLGFMNPANGYSSPNGDFGVYFTHGGDWYHGSGELHSCVMAFPIKVEASLLINSERGGFSSQCAVLRDAFDNAWVP
jgi:CubicO group peptidase (beta-lactamase class C family)